MPFHRKLKKSYIKFRKAPTIGERALMIGRKIQKLPSRPKFKKIRSKGIKIKGNIDYYFQN